jgi:hypothetical protein
MTGRNNRAIFALLPQTAQLKAAEKGSFVANPKLRSAVVRPQAGVIHSHCKSGTPAK